MFHIRAKLGQIKPNRQFVFIRWPLSEPESKSGFGAIFQPSLRELAGVAAGRDSNTRKEGGEEAVAKMVAGSEGGNAVTARQQLFKDQEHEKVGPKNRCNEWISCVFCGLP